MKRYLIVKSIKRDLLFPPCTHPFLGASPDGVTVVLKECLVEVKRIFPEPMTLKEAVCSRGICKKTSSGLIVNQNHACILLPSATTAVILFRLSI